ncbi:MAG: hypothetical protein K9N55_13640 [Phycisphaerae bacterium]|nr:hypothetical protein [Phycisphaerae bacterium]
MQKKPLICGLIVLLVVLMASGMAFAQPAQGQRGQRGQGGQGMRGNFDPAAMQQRMQERMMEQLGMDADEIKAIQPLLTKVQEINRELQGGRMRGMMGGRGGRGGAGQQDAAPLTGLAKTQNDLETLLDNPSATTAQIKGKLTEYRKGVEKLQQELTAAQTKLAAVLTVKQEARLVLMGMLK